MQIDAVAEHIGRCTHVELGLVGDDAATLTALRPLLTAREDRSHLESARERYLSWVERQRRLTAPDYDHARLGRLRRLFDNPDHAIRPEQLAAAVDRHAGDDTVFTSDTGMSTVWLSRFVTMRGTRRLVGSYNLGSMVNAMPQALGAQALDRGRQVIAFCGDGGLTMLMGDMITAVASSWWCSTTPGWAWSSWNRSSPGCPSSAPSCATPTSPPVARACGLHGIRVENPDDLDDAVRGALTHDGPVLLDVVTNPEEISIPGRINPAQTWGFAIAKITEAVRSAREN